MCGLKRYINKQHSKKGFFLRFSVKKKEIERRNDEKNVSLEDNNEKVILGIIKFNKSIY